MLGPVARLEWLARVATSPAITRAAIAVAAVLATFKTAPGGELYPGVEKIATLAGITGRSVQAGVRQLVASGFLVCDERASPIKTNIYRIVETVNGSVATGENLGIKPVNGTSPNLSSDPGVMNTAAPPKAGYALSDGDMAMVAAFDVALVTTWGDGAKRPRMASTDPATARQLVSLGITPEAFRAVCLDVMGKAAVSTRPAPGSLSYCLKAAMEGRSAAPTQFAGTAKTPVVYLPQDEEADRLAYFARTGKWPTSWGPRPAGSASTFYIHTPEKEAADHLASFGRTGIWHESWGPRPKSTDPVNSTSPSPN